MLKVKGLVKHFPVYSGIFRRQAGTVKAVNGIDLEIGEKEVLGLVGESGSGKSTTGRAVIRLIQPTAGKIHFLGKELVGIDKRLQIIFQDPFASLNPRKTIAESMGEGLVYYGMVKNIKERDDYVVETLKKVGLTSDVLYRYPHQFSGGQQQRICIGRAIIMNPKLIVCDEAVSALDVSVQAQIMNLLQELKETMGLTLLFISHDLSVVRHICDRVIVLYLGKIMEEGTTEEIFENPKHPYTQALLSAIPKSFPGEKKERMILTGEIPSARYPPSGCPFRTRCPFAKPICAQTPPRKEPKKGHVYHCILD